jgi:hypothetical protein
MNGSTSTFIFHVGASGTGKHFFGEMELSGALGYGEVPEELLDPVAATPFRAVTRVVEGGEVRLLAYALHDVEVPSPTGVSDAGNVWLTSTSSPFVMLQSGFGAYWFWDTEAGGDVAPYEIPNPGPSGRSAWIHVEGPTHVLVAQRNASVSFRTVLCPHTDGEGDEVACGTDGSGPGISLMASDGEVPGGVALADGRVAALIKEIHPNGDWLGVALLDADLQTIHVARIELLDLRGSGERVTDAHVDLVETDSASTLTVAVAVGSDENGASRVLMTGVRACEM